ncbi:hypothetical protein CC2G_008539 [Coprinopsis cinerea AmutBmut pab1-1]|nr:hypothetical protein CC2G_008539 [Coprinopsis cinerea AmutBmut pab1-1]
MVWAGFYFAYRGVVDGSKYCYNGTRKAFRRNSEDLAGSEDEKTSQFSRSGATSQWGASPYLHPHPSAGAHRVSLAHTNEDDLESTDHSHSARDHVGVIQQPPKAIPSMKIVHAEYGTRYDRPQDHVQSHGIHHEDRPSVVKFDRRVSTIDIHGEREEFEDDVSSVESDRSPIRTHPSERGDPDRGSPASVHPSHSQSSSSRPTI